MQADETLKPESIKITYDAETYARIPVFWRTHHEHHVIDCENGKILDKLHECKTRITEEYI